MLTSDEFAKVLANEEKFAVVTVRSAEFTVTWTVAWLVQYAQLAVDPASTANPTSAVRAATRRFAFVSQLMLPTGCHQE